MLGVHLAEKLFQFFLGCTSGGVVLVLALVLVLLVLLVMVLVLVVSRWC